MTDLTGSTRLEGQANTIGKEPTLYFIQNIRTLLTIMVVLIHLNVTYSTFGKWYYTEPWSIDATALGFAMYGMLSQAFVLGLFFFIAGYFSAYSYDLKGTSLFIQSRLIRLGVPTLVYMLVIHPLTIQILNVFGMIQIESFIDWYIKYVAQLTFLSNSGPLWFTLALLVFSLVYALARHVSTTSSPISLALNNGMSIFLLGLCLIAITDLFAFVVRVFIPAGESFLNNDIGNFMQLGFFPSYIVLFVTGILFFRFDLLGKLSLKTGYFWLGSAVLIGLPVWLLTIVTGGLMTGSGKLFGGLTWQSLAYSCWESFFAVAMTFGLLSLFQQKFNLMNRPLRFLSSHSFTVYVIHTPILVLITLLLRDWSIAPIFKTYLVALIVIPCCYLVAYLILKIRAFVRAA